jgi:hypothetical protein
MATELCQKCKQAHPGRACDYDEKGECAEMIAVDEVAPVCNEPAVPSKSGASAQPKASKSERASTPVVAVTSESAARTP